MKVILEMAISADGFVAKKNDDTNWVAKTDWDYFLKIVKDSRCIVMGRRTYEVSGNLFPYDCELNIVVTSDKNLHKKSTDRVLFTNKNPKEILRLVNERGFDRLLVVGGGKLNASFLKENLIDEIYLSVHPKILGEGIKLFDGGEIDVDLELLGVKEMNGDLVQLHYRVLQSREVNPLSTTN